MIHKRNNFGVRICDHKATTRLESSYHWENVTCKKCLAEKPKPVPPYSIKIERRCGNCANYNDPIDCPVEVFYAENKLMGKDFCCNFWRSNA